MNELVTIIMSAYNHGEYVEDAIKSVLNQTYKNYKFIVADDASTDNTVDVLMKYEDVIDEIHLYDTNSGYGRGSELILLSQTKYTAIINSDDRWEPQKLEKQITYMEQHPEYGACFTWCDEVDEDGKSMDSQVFQVANRLKEEWMFYFWKKGNCLAHPSILIRTELYQKLCRVNNNVFRQIPDFNMWLKLIQKWEIYVIEENLVKFLHHKKNENVSAGTVANFLRNDMEYIWYKCIKKMDDDYFKKTFREVMINPYAQDHKEILCEKYFVLCVSPIESIKSSAVLYYYDVFQNIENYNVLREKYGYTNWEFHQQEMQMGKGKRQADLMSENDRVRGLLNQLLEKVTKE